MDTLDEPKKHFHLSNVWTVGNTFSLLTSLGSLVIMAVGGVMMLTRMQTASQEIPNLLEVTKAQSLDIAVLKDQQRNLDGKYTEIMLQLSRLDAKLDKQNEYLFDSLQRISGRQKNSYQSRNSSFPGILEKVSTVRNGSSPSP